MTSQHLTARHLLAVWDPSRERDAMHARVQLLLDVRRRQRAGEVDDEEAYVWWGKIRSPNRQQPLAHLPEVLALDALLRDERGPDAVVLDDTLRGIAELGIVRSVV